MGIIDELPPLTQEPQQPKGIIDSLPDLTQAAAPTQQTGTGYEFPAGTFTPSTKYDKTSLLNRFQYASRHGLNTSTGGIVHKLATGKTIYDTGDYKPEGIFEKGVSTIYNFLHPIDLGTFGVGGKAAGFAFSKVAPKLSEKLLESGLAPKVVQGILENIGRSATLSGSIGTQANVKNAVAGQPLSIEPYATGALAGAAGGFVTTAASRVIPATLAKTLGMAAEAETFAQVPSLVHSKKLATPEEQLLAAIPLIVSHLVTGKVGDEEVGSKQEQAQTQEIDTKPKEGDTLGKETEETPPAEGAQGHNEVTQGTQGYKQETPKGPQEDAVLEPVVGPNFYSRLRHFVASDKNKMPAVMSPGEARSFLRKNNSEEEVKWSGVDALLDKAEAEGRKVTKAEILGAMQESVVGEVVKRDAFTSNEIKSGASIEKVSTHSYKATYEGVSATGLSPEEATGNLVVAYTEATKGTSWQQVTLPGGKGYTEVVLTQHTPPIGMEEASKTRNFDYADPLEKQRRIERYANSPQTRYSSSHWEDIPNPLVHMRFDFRDGGKTLFVQEIQSDWHQSGRKGGYKDESIDAASRMRATEARVEALDDYQNNVAELRASGVDAPGMATIIHEIETDPDKARTTHGNELVSIAERYMDARSLADSVPNAPFSKDWVRLAFKRILLEAVKQGVTRIELPADKTAELIEGGAGYKNEGMREFYNKVVPAEVNNLLKPLGLKLEKSTIDSRGIPSLDEATGERLTSNEERDFKHASYGVTLTPEAISHIMTKGIPLFGPIPKLRSEAKEAAGSPPTLPPPPTSASTPSEIPLPEGTPAASIIDEGAAGSKVEYAPPGDMPPTPPEEPPTSSGSGSGAGGEEPSPGTPRTTEQLAASATKKFAEGEAEIKAKRDARAPLISQIMQKFVDRSYDVKQVVAKLGRLGEQAIMKFDLIKGAHPEANRVFDVHSPASFKGLSEIGMRDLGRVNASRRILDVASRKPDHSYTKDIKVEEAQAYLDNLQKTQSKYYDKLITRSDNFNKTMRFALDEMYNAELIDDRLFDELIKSKFYSPFEFIQHIDPDAYTGSDTTTAGHPVSVHTGLAKMSKGSVEAMEMNPRLLMNEVLQRTYNRIFRNNANSALLDATREIVHPAELSKSFMREHNRLEPVPDGWKRIDMIKVEPDATGKTRGLSRSLIMKEELADQWSTSDTTMNQAFANFLRWTSGSNIVKMGATGLNPKFALRNLFLDNGLKLIASPEYSSVVPVAQAQVLADLAATLKDAISRTGLFEEFSKNGGQTDLLTYQGRVAKEGSILSGLEKFMGKAGEISETWGRLAHMRRAMLNGKTAEEAAYVARSFPDFSQGGSWAKAIDTTIPYFNAGIQGTRTLAKAFAERPGETSARVVQMMAISAGLKFAADSLFGHVMQQVPQSTKENNFIIPLGGLYRVDDKGVKHYYYLPIPKDQGLRPFTTVGEGILDKTLGKNTDDSMLAIEGRAAAQSLPANPVGGSLLPPTLKAFATYFSNYDFWNNKKIWNKDENISPGLERSGNAPLDAMGEKLGISPKRLQHALSTIVPNSSVYSDLMGITFGKMVNGLDEAARQKATSHIIDFVPLARETNPIAQQAEVVQKQSTKEADENFLRKEELQKLVENKGDLGAFLKKIPQDKIESAVRSYVSDITNVQTAFDSFFRMSGQLSPEGKATVFADLYSRAGEEDRAGLIASLKKKPDMLKNGMFLKGLADRGVSLKK